MILIFDLFWESYRLSLLLSQLLLSESIPNQDEFEETSSVKKKKKKWSLIPELDYLGLIDSDNSNCDNSKLNLYDSQNKSKINIKPIPNS